MCVCSIGLKASAQIFYVFGNISRGTKWALFRIEIIQIFVFLGFDWIELAENELYIDLHIPAVLRSSPCQTTFEVDPKP